ncbi:MAG: 6-bladed beta-propeller [Atribacterota bacterium]|jgi:hypothetical protein|nr:6-bladed beta-propeller [Atribacterota bacterium]
MKKITLFLFIITVFSCEKTKNSENKLIHIDPRTFTKNEIKLSEIAGDVKYIPLDNEFPIGVVYSYKIIGNFIYAAIKDAGVFRFTNEGILDKQYGSIGRGPAEYVYCLKFAFDPESGTVYVMDHKMSDIEVYSKNGMHLKNISLPKDEDGFGFSDIEFYKSSLILAQYLNMGRGDYDWIVLDTLGNKIAEKKNSYLEFRGRVGGDGGLFKYGDNLGYWDKFKDTIFSISSDFTYKALCVIEPGEHRLPMTAEKYNPVKEFNKKLGKYLQGHLFLRTGNFYLYEYFFENKFRLAIIDEIEGKAKSIDLKNLEGGIINDIDNGLPFIPDVYFEKKGKDHLVSLIQPFKLKAKIASDSFKNSTPKYPEKKKELEKLANSLDENDNPVLMLVKLKE